MTQQPPTTCFILVGGVRPVGERGGRPVGGFGHLSDKNRRTKSYQTAPQQKNSPYPSAFSFDLGYFTRPWRAASQLRHPGTPWRLTSPCAQLAIDGIPTTRAAHCPHTDHDPSWTRREIGWPSPAAFQWRSTWEDLAVAVPMEEDLGR